MGKRPTRKTPASSNDDSPEAVQAYRQIMDALEVVQGATIWGYSVQTPALQRFHAAASGLKPHLIRSSPLFAAADAASGRHLSLEGYLSIAISRDCNIFIELARQGVGMFAAVRAAEPERHELRRLIEKAEERVSAVDKRATESKPDEHGLVKDPIDSAAYIPKGQILSGEKRGSLNLTEKKIDKILREHPEIRRWSPRRRRLSVHRGDWEKFTRAFSSAGADDPAEIAQRTAAQRKTKRGK